MKLEILFESIKVTFGTAKSLQSSVHIVLMFSLVAFIFDRDFVCPCVTAEAAETACGDHSKFIGSDKPKCVPLYNQWFSSMFFVLPAAILFVLVPGEYISWEKLRESIRPQYDSVTHDCQECKIERARYLQKCLGLVLVPIIWIIFALCDGRYYACLQTPLPYDVDNGTCREELSKKSTAYKENQTKSVILGLQVAIAISIVALFLFLLINYHDPSSQEKMQNDQVQHTCKAEVAKQTTPRLKSSPKRERVNTIFDWNKSRKRNSSNSSNSSSSNSTSVTTRSMSRCR